MLTFPVFGQQRIPVFATKQDSLVYENLSRNLESAFKNPLNPQRLDSLLAAQRKWVSERAVRYRTMYRATPGYTNYRDIGANHQAVTRLTLSYFNGKDLPDSLYLCTNLVELELVNTHIRALPKKLEQLKSLRKVTLLNNRPKRKIKLNKNPNIETLIIHNDEINRLPRHYRQLSKLKTLDLSRNALSAIPKIRNKGVRRLLLSDNKISLRSQLEKLSSLQELVLTSNAMKNVPGMIGSFTSLKKLNLSANEIEEIAPEFSRLQNLEELSLYKNKLRSIPASLYEIKNLRIIDLYYNQLEQLSPSIANWSNLEVLYAANNRLFSLPENIGSLGKLRELYVHHNRLSTLPASIAHLDSLRVLRVNDNMLIDLPKGLYQLWNLENLDIDGNQIQLLPEELFNFPHLKILSLKNNPLEASSQAAVIQWAERAERDRKVVVHFDNLK